jgi:hypothetical protein
MAIWFSRFFLPPGFRRIALIYIILPAQPTKLQYCLQLG